MNRIQKHVADRAERRKKAETIPERLTTAKQQWARRIAASKLRNANEELELAATALRTHDHSMGGSVDDLIRDIKKKIKELM